ncbi:type II secretion system F family protein, partial [Rhodopirellula sp.]
NLGIPLDEAIENMAKRVPNMDVRFFATAVVLQRQTGGDLAEILDKISRLIRERLQILGQIQALTGEGRMSGAVLLALPPVLFVVMLKLNYQYVMTLFQDPIGRYMLFGGLVTQVIGALVIKKIITIKV